MAAATVDKKLQFYIWTGQKGSNLRSQITEISWTYHTESNVVRSVENDDDK